MIEWDICKLTKWAAKNDFRQMQKSLFQEDLEMRLTEVSSYHWSIHLQIKDSRWRYYIQNWERSEKVLGCCKRFVNFLSSENRLDTLKTKVLTAAMITTQSKQLTWEEEQEIFVRVEIKTRIVTALRIIFRRHAILGTKINSGSVNKILNFIQNKNEKFEKCRHR